MHLPSQILCQAGLQGSLVFWTALQPGLRECGKHVKALCMTDQKCRAVLGQPRMRLSSACNWQWHGWTILSNASAFV